MGARSEKLDIINSLYKKSDKEKREGVGGGGRRKVGVGCSDLRQGH